MVLQGQIFTSEPSERPSSTSLSKIGFNSAFGPANIAATYSSAERRYDPGSASQVDWPSAYSAIHQA